MKFAEINAIYTNVVSDWIGKGYTINAGTMSGSQTDEMAHIDFTDGNSVYRIVMEKFHETDDELFPVHGIQIIAGRVSNDIKPNQEKEFGAIIWNNEILPMEIYKFYQITDRLTMGKTSENFWGTEREAVTAEKKRRERQRRADRLIYAVPVDDPKAIEIAKRFITRKTGKKRIRRNAIKLYKNNTTHGYDVIYFGNNYRMR